MDEPSVKYEDGVLACLGCNDEEVPAWLVQKGPDAHTVDLSFGRIMNVAALKGFASLTTLILDQNEMEGFASLPTMPSLTTLSANKNNITSLRRALKNIARRCPNLNFLSLMGNPCCPNELNGGTDAQYTEYRKTAAAKLSELRYLDSNPISEDDRPITVSSITTSKLDKGMITSEEHAHIMRINALILGLDTETTTEQMLASSDEEESEDDDDGGGGGVGDDGIAVTMSANTLMSNAEKRLSKQDMFDQFLKQSRGDGDGDGDGDGGGEDAAGGGRRESGPDPDGLAVFQKTLQFDNGSDGGVAAAGTAAAVSPKDSYNEIQEPLYDTRTVGADGTPTATATATAIDAAPAAAEEKPHVFRPVSTLFEEAEPAEVPRSTTNATVTTTATTTATASPATAEEPAEPPTRAEEMAAWATDFAEIGQVRHVELTRGPTGLDMRMAHDGEYFRVVDVSPRGSADQAGIEVGDVLLAANGVGLVGASDAQADEIMFRDLIVTFDVAAMSLPLPEGGANGSANASTTSTGTGFSRGAMSKSFAARPVYCEVVVARIDGELGFVINTTGVEPTIEITDTTKLAAKVKTGDVITAVEGDAVNNGNVNELLAAQGERFDIDVIRYVDTSGGVVSRPSARGNSSSSSSNGGSASASASAATGTTPYVTALSAAALAAEMDDARLLAMKRQAEAMVGLQDGWSVRLASGGADIVYVNTAGVQQAHRPGSEPAAAAGLVFDCEFKGAATGNQALGQDKKAVRAAKKQAAKQAKLARKLSKDDVTVDLSELPGMIRLAFRPDSVQANRLPKVPKRLLSMQQAGDLVFELKETDIFTVLTRKKKLLFMVQPAPPNPTKCFIVKVGNDKECKQAEAAAKSLPGHIEMPSKPAKPPRRASKEEKRAAKKQEKEEKKREKEEKKRAKKMGKEMKKKGGSSSSVASTASTVSAASTASATTATAATAGDEKPKARRKLVRGGNAYKPKVLPEFTAAMEAIEELDKFLDQFESTDAYLAAASSNITRGKDVSKAKSRKWMREASRKVLRGMPESPEGSEDDGDGGGGGDDDGSVSEADAEGDREMSWDKLKRGSTTSLNSMASMSSMGSMASSIGDDDEEDNSEIFRVLEEKRKEREADLVVRQAELAAQASIVAAEQAAHRKIEMARIERQQAVEQEELLAYKEYCHVGAQRRMQALSFKFKWGGTDRKSGTEM